MTICTYETESNFEMSITFTDKNTDLDVPLEYVSLDNYCATLGHKACHTFGKRKNARFESLWHPRFGHIMSVVALKTILTGEEILVNYNYDLKIAPEWYKALWQEFMQGANT